MLPPVGFNGYLRTYDLYLWQEQYKLIETLQVGYFKHTEMMTL